MLVDSVVVDIGPAQVHPQRGDTAVLLGHVGNRCETVSSVDRSHHQPQRSVADKARVVPGRFDGECEVQARTSAARGAPARGATNLEFLIYHLFGTAAMLLFQEYVRSDRSRKDGQSTSNTGPLATPAKRRRGNIPTVDSQKK